MRGDESVPTSFAECTLDIDEKRGKGYPLTLLAPQASQTGTLRLAPASAVLRSQLSRLKAFKTDEEFLRELGFALFQAVFPPRLLKIWHTSRQSLPPDGRLRLKLIVRPPELAALPWELMCDEDGIPLATATPIVRYLACPDPPKPLEAPPPLRILVTIASPRDQAPLSSQREHERIAAALAPLVKQGLVHLTVSQGATGIGLLNDLRQGAHIWHFIGHGLFDARAANGSLAFENESGDTDLIDAKRLRILLEQSSVRLAILNGCETGRFSIDPLLGIAPALVRAGVPAVVAMQFAVPDTSAVEFSSMFYRALADGYPVDACVSEGRKAVITRLGLGLPDWATPVLYMRSPDGHLFSPMHLPGNRQTRPAPAPKLVAAGPPSLRDMDTASLLYLLANGAEPEGYTGEPRRRVGDAAVPDRPALRLELARRQGCGV